MYVCDDCGRLNPSGVYSERQMARENPLSGYANLPAGSEAEAKAADTVAAGAAGQGHVRMRTQPAVKAYWAAAQARSE